MFLSYASRDGHALIDRALDLPESWAPDRQRRAAAGVPETIPFATKPKLGRALLERALMHDVDPQVWRADGLSRIAEHPAPRIDKRPPWNWQRQPAKRAA